MNTFTFEQQAKFFEKKLNLKTDSYLDVLGEEHDYFFMVAGANRNEVLLAFREAVDAAIENGETLEQFRSRFDEIVAKTGWQYNGGRNWRTRVIYDTNVYASYNQGRYQQQLELAEVMPYWEYQHNDSLHPRPEHEEWDGLVLRFDDPWWRYHYPIRAYGCHCTVVAHDDDDLQTYGKKVGVAPPTEWQEKEIGRRSGNPRVVRIPKGVDPSFEHPQSLTPINQVDQLLLHKLATNTKLDKGFVASTARNLMDNPSIMAAMNQSMGKWVDDIATSLANNDKTLLQQASSFKYLGALPKEVVSQLDNKLDTAIIAIDKGQMVHSLRELKKTADIVLPESFWRSLPEKLQHPTAILLEKGQKSETLLFVYQMDNAKVAVKVNYKAKVNIEGMERWTTKLNMVATGSKVAEKEWIDSFKHFELLWGNLPQ